MAFFLDSPRIVHCFSAAADTNPDWKAGAGYEIEYLVKDRAVTAGETWRSGSA